MHPPTSQPFNNHVLLFLLAVALSILASSFSPESTNNSTGVKKPSIYSLSNATVRFQWRGAKKRDPKVWCNSIFAISVTISSFFFFFLLKILNYFVLCRVTSDPIPSGGPSLPIPNIPIWYYFPLFFPSIVIKGFEKHENVFLINLNLDLIRF